MLEVWRDTETRAFAARLIVSEEPFRIREVAQSRHPQVLLNRFFSAAEVKNSESAGDATVGVSHQGEPSVQAATSVKEAAQVPGHMKPPAAELAQSNRSRLQHQRSSEALLALSSLFCLILSDIYVLPELGRASWHMWKLAIFG